MSRPLFVAGPGRSGTTALVRYLNVHPEILVCRERFAGWPRERITPELFTPERIMDFEDGYEQRHRPTYDRWEIHKDILRKKDFGTLKWLGDKVPNYTKSLHLLAKNNPGAKFLLTYRPVEEVAASAEARSRDPEDHWLGGKDGFKMGIRQWNRALRQIRRFIEDSGEALVISYRDFFGEHSRGEVELIADFLGVDIPMWVRGQWSEMNNEHRQSKLSNEFLTARQRQTLEELASRKAESYVLRCIERQRRRLLDSKR